MGQNIDRKFTTVRRIPGREGLIPEGMSYRNVGVHHREHRGKRKKETTEEKGYGDTG
jgi:hypothetical protein